MESRGGPRSLAESRGGHGYTWAALAAGELLHMGTCVVTEPRPNTSGLSVCLNIGSYQYRPNIYTLRENPHSKRFFNSSCTFI